jgi:hypothetical protein
MGKEKLRLLIEAGYAMGHAIPAEDHRDTAFRNPGEYLELAYDQRRLASHIKLPAGGAADNAGAGGAGNAGGASAFNRTVMYIATFPKCMATVANVANNIRGYVQAKETPGGVPNPTLAQFQAGHFASNDAVKAAITTAFETLDMFDKV